MLKFVGQPVGTFTGRGAFSETLKAARERQSEARAEMLLLVASSKVDGCPVYLQTHVRNNGTRELRWRTRTGQHLRWEACHDLLTGLPMAIQRHCDGVNRRSRELFALDAMCEQVARWCESVLQRKPMRGRSASDATGKVSSSAVIRRQW